MTFFSSFLLQVYTFIRIPKEMEKFMLYALLQLTDAFLYIFTFLPIRMVLALAELRPVSSSLSSSSSSTSATASFLATSPAQRLPQRKLFPGLSNASFRRSARRLAPAQICDLLKVMTPKIELEWFGAGGTIK